MPFYSFRQGFVQSNDLDYKIEVAVFTTAYLKCAVSKPRSPVTVILKFLTTHFNLFPVLLQKV